MGRVFDIRREIELPASPEQVWEAITTRRGLAGWLWDQPAPEGLTPAAWDPPRRLRIELPPGEDGATQAFEYVIEAREGGLAVLRFVHSGFLGDSWEGDYDFGAVTGHGWDMYLHTLAEYLEHFRDRTPTYITADAPPVSAQESAWPVLLAALGVEPAVSTGDRVQVAVDGLHTIDGVADYVGSSFLGVRTDDALYRFHGRAGIGLPIAVGHHLFAGGVDAERTRAAWSAWLGRVFEADRVPQPNQA
jgi:uncharacterized protein YndB with AHSA1/START domain